MANWKVVNRATEEIVYAYTSDDPVEWSGMEFSLCNHIKEPEVIIDSSLEESNWKIYVGAFFDRFVDSKLAILSSTDPVVKAIITDSSVRKYIDLKGRRDELYQALLLLQSKGFVLDIISILDSEPTEDELWQPFIL